MFPTINITAVDIDGIPLFSREYVNQIYVAHYADTADFGVGEDIQVVSADSRRAVHYRGFDLGVLDVQFDLYRIPPEKFAERYVAHNWETDSLLLAKSWTEQTREEGDYSLNPQELLIPEDVPAGAYILNLSGDFLNDQLFILLTNHQLTLKKDDEQIAAWVDGSAAADGIVRFYAADGRLLHQEQTGDDGIVTANITAETPAFVTAQQGTEIVMAKTSWGNEYYSPSAAPLHIHISTERPIYKPGDTVYFKAILRSDDDAHLEPIPEGSAVTVTLYDARGNRVKTAVLNSNDYGTVNGSFLIGEGATVGSYRIEAAFDGTMRALRFKVEEYRKPEYKVTISTDSHAYLLDDEIIVTIESAYFFGEPLADAEVTLTLYDREWYYGEDDLRMGRTVRLDENGRLTTTISVENAGRLLIEAIVDDGSNQTVAAQAVVHIYEIAESIQFQRGSYMKTPDTPFTIDGTVRDIWGDGINGRSVTLKLTRYTWESRDYTDIVDQETVVTDENGRFSLQLIPDETGYYRLIATATDQLGNRIESTNWLAVYDTRYRSRWVRRTDDIGVSADQDTYKPGDTARLFIESSTDGMALLTLERGTLHSQQTVELTPPLTVVEIPITDAHVPNIYAVIHAWKPISNTLPQGDSYYSDSIPDAELVIASTILYVPADHKRLTLTITPDKEVYAPGDEATFTIRATNPAGDPVSAEIALAVVDEAIFTLADDNTPILYDTFYFWRGSSVHTYHSMYPRRDLWIPNGNGGCGGGGGEGGGLGNPRQDFQDTAAWYPTLRTDFNGETAVTFTLPDDLTSWRLTAHAVTADTQVGKAVENVTVRQDLLIRPLMPRILTDGDQLTLSALVHNYTDQPQEIAVTVAVSPTLMQIDGSATQTITVPADGVMVVGWAATAVAPADLTVTMAAIPADESVAGDAVQLPLTIQPLAILDLTTVVGEFESETSLTVDMPDSALDMSFIRVDLSRSIAGSLTDGLDYLTGFPYGCVEQTMSKALPNAVVGRAFHQLGVGDPAVFAALEPKIQASIQRLYGFQHSDGGWGWWTTDPTHDYQTAWVVFGLTMTADAGYEVDPAVIERGAGWLNENLGEMDIRTRAYALYSMAIAGYGNLDETLALVERADELDTFSQSALALTLHELGETAVSRELLDMLAETAVVNDGFAHWQGDSSDGHYYRKTMASDLRNTALALSAFAQIQPSHPLEAQISRWLMGQRGAHGWGTTNETSFAILGLTDYLLNNKEFNTPMPFTILLNGAKAATGELGGGRPFYTIDIPAAGANKGENSIIISSSDGKLYYTVSRRAYVSETNINAAGVVDVERVYRDPHTGRPVDSVQTGDVIEVELTVTLADDGSYLIIEDKLPGGLEALNDNLNTTSVAAAFTERQQYNYTHKETWGDRVSYFVTDMGKGKHTLTHYARATQSGTFTAMPTEVYAMYDLAMWGRSASALLQVFP